MAPKLLFFVAIVALCVVRVTADYDSITQYHVLGRMALWNAALYPPQWTGIHPLAIPIPSDAVQVKFLSNMSTLVNYNLNPLFPPSGGYRPGTPLVGDAIGPQNGISGYTGPCGALIGLFLQSELSQPSKAPPTLNFRNDTGMGTSNYTELKPPQFGQVFYIGAGVPTTFDPTTGDPTPIYNGADPRIAFDIPAGALYLYLGIPEAYFGPSLSVYGDNSGYYQVGVQFLKSCAICGNGIVEYPEQCDSSSPCCIGCNYAANSTLCRAQGGPCDSSELCTGTSDVCPNDVYAGNQTVCRPSAGVCDIPENCTGSTAACPLDAVKSSTIQCRASAGDCDVPENCTGSGPLCPVDSFDPSTYLCRPRSETCDTDQYCTGNTSCCPLSTIDAAARSYLVFGTDSVFYTSDTDSDSSADSAVEIPIPDCAHFVVFNATGNVNYTYASLSTTYSYFRFSPQGNNVTGSGTGYYPLSFTNSNGNPIVSGYDGPRGALLGVFVGSPFLPVVAAPATTNFVGGLSGPSYAPVLNQVFYVGNGFPTNFPGGLAVTTTPTQISYAVPLNAQFLYLGLANTPGYYGYLTGYYSTTVQFSS